MVLPTSSQQRINEATDQGDIYRCTYAYKCCGSFAFERYSTAPGAAVEH